MDHKLAIVILPPDTVDPVKTSAAVLGRFQKIPSGNFSAPFEPKFRYKRVGGWFDGLVNGWVGKERWSTVLRMLLDGSVTDASSPLPGFGPETASQIEARIETDNTIDIDAISQIAPCSIIVTPEGEWIARPNPDSLDAPPARESGASDEEAEEWARIKRDLFRQYRGCKAVAWDLSWHFIGAPADQETGSAQRTFRSWGAGNHPSNATRSAWAARIAEAQQLVDRQTMRIERAEAGAAIDRWVGEGGASTQSETLAAAS